MITMELLRKWRRGTSPEIASTSTRFSRADPAARASPASAWTSLTKKSAQGCASITSVMLFASTSRS